MPEVYTEENKNWHIHNKWPRNKESFYNSSYTKAEILKMRFYYTTHTALETYNYFNLHTSFLHFKNVLIGQAYFDLPIYSKVKQK